MINSFNGNYRFLSNFFESPVLFEKKVYPTVEHAYQAAKTTDDAAREKICRAKTPGSAKRIGRKVKLRPLWDTIKINIMYNLLKQKFTVHPELYQQLLDTDNEELIEGNTWKDTFWGVCNGVGENWLGKLLMKVRKELQDADKD